MSSAARRGYEWTGPDLELAARTDLTVSEIANMLGRTYQAVTNMRKKLRTHPKFQRLAGVADDTSGDRWAATNPLADSA